MMKNIILLLSIFVLFIASSSAEVYKYVDPKGHIIYTDTPRNKHISPVKLAPLTNYEAVKPKVTEDESSKNINSTLHSNNSQNNLAKEQQALIEAKKALADAQKIRLGGDHNYAMYLARIKGLQKAVNDQEKKLSNLQSNPIKNSNGNIK